jgi:hypothetical protein
LGTAYEGKTGDFEPSNPKGEAFTENLFPSGFILNLTVSFERNTSPDYTDAQGQQRSFINGYIQPDFKKSENVALEVRHKMDLLGNSGVRFCGKEIQIFDIRGLQNDLSVTVNKIVNNTIPADSSWVIDYIEVDGINYGKNGEKDERTRVCNVITGNIYEDQRITPASDNQVQIFQKFTDALDRQPGASYELEIDVTVNGNQLHVVTKSKIQIIQFSIIQLRQYPIPTLKIREYICRHIGALELNSVP